jgi:hypothetical protein
MGCRFASIQNPALPSRLEPLYTEAVILASEARAAREYSYLHRYVVLSPRELSVNQDLDSNRILLSGVR